MCHIVHIDDEIVNEAFSVSGIKTKRELVEHRKRLDLRVLKGIGELRSDYDYNALRTGKVADTE